jgi:hypothetical protein
VKALHDAVGARLRGALLGERGARTAARREIVALALALQEADDAAERALKAPAPAEEAPEEEPSAEGDAPVSSEQRTMLPTGEPAPEAPTLFERRRELRRAISTIEG